MGHQDAWRPCSQVIMNWFLFLNVTCFKLQTEKKNMKHTIKLEQEYTGNDIICNHMVKEFVINMGNNSSSEGLNEGGFRNI